ASIVVHPESDARAAAVAYLYCRALDTYEDLIPKPATSAAALIEFANRFETDPPAAPPPLPSGVASSDRERVYEILIDRIELIDEVYRELDPGTRDRIAGLVRAMAEGMVWSRDTFDAQGGVLLDEEQLARYCRHVIGNPVLFMLEQVGDRDLDADSRENALVVSEMIQLANVSRDVESDLNRGIAYHPSLAPYLGRSGYEPEVIPTVREVRGQYIALALSRAPAYRRMFEGLELDRSVRVRVASVLMLLFTDLHYRGCAIRAGLLPWPGPADRLQVVLSSAPSLVSRTLAGRTIRRVERDFTSAANLIGPTAPHA
ncbi:MAG: squalene/phytoene synthase family protein, partial [Solirubrobacterales bacterium]